MVGRSRLMPFRGLNETSPRRESQIILNANQSGDLLHVSDNTLHHHIPPRTRRRSIFLRFNRLGGKFFGRLGVITSILVPITSSSSTSRGVEDISLSFLFCSYLLSSLHLLWPTKARPSGEYHKLEKDQGQPTQKKTVKKMGQRIQR